MAGEPDMGYSGVSLFKARSLQVPVQMELHHGLLESSGCSGSHESTVNLTEFLDPQLANRNLGRGLDLDAEQSWLVVR